MKRTAYQAGHIWAQTRVAQQKLPCPAEWGWEMSDDGWKPRWTTLPEAEIALRQHTVYLPPEYQLIICVILFRTPFYNPIHIINKIT